MKTKRHDITTVIVIVASLVMAFVFMYQGEKQVQQLTEQLKEKCPEAEPRMLGGMSMQGNRVCIIYKDSYNNPAKEVCEYYYNTAEEVNL